MAFGIKKCIVCKKEIEKPIKKYGSNFCSEECLKNYEKMLEEAKKKVNLNKCC
jgi:predicted nucleic acid-binding Zn ribbon protein